MTVKSLTGNVELITILNRFGHGLSYSQVEEVETALAETQIAKQQNGVFVPSACHPNVSGVLCWDNNDLQEETLSGKLSDNFAPIIVPISYCREGNNSLH